MYLAKDQTKGVRSIGLIDWFRNKKKSSSNVTMASRPSRTSPFDSYFSLYLPTAKAKEQFQLYEVMRKAIPVLDAAIQRKVALLGDVKIITDNDKDEKWINDILAELEVNKFGRGLNKFLEIFADRRYLYGIGVGEIVMTKNRKLHSVVNVEVPTIEFVSKSNHPLDVVIAQRQNGQFEPVELSKDFILISAVKGDLSNLYGVSLFEKLPFIAGILHTVFHTENLVWERFGNLSYHVNYEPDNDNLTSDEIRSRMDVMKKEWQDSMRKKTYGESADYFTTGKFTVNVMGAEGQILNVDITSRVLLEQIIGNLGMPPWVLGFHWSTSERLSQKQLEILTAELNTDRRLIAPIVYKIVDTLCAGEGRVFPYEVKWDSLNLEDMLEKARSRLLNAQAERYETETAIKRRNEGIINQNILAQELGYEKPAAPKPMIS